MKHILVIFGTRPEAIKMAPVVHALKKQKNIRTAVCVTAQHRQMLDQVLDFFEIVPDYDLNLMTANQTLTSLSSTMLLAMKEVLDDFKPDWVLVHGDTTTSFIASLAAFYAGARVCHVEAGLRTYNKTAPFPEEINRQLTARIADVHFAPTVKAKSNLVAENIPPETVLVTGNTVIDALFLGLQKIDHATDLNIEKLKTSIPTDKPFILVTGHRRENFGDKFNQICLALKDIAQTGKANIVYPVHLNPKVQDPVQSILGGQPNVYLVEPQPYPTFIWLLRACYLAITDSGGVQEEAPSLGKPVLVLREVTERPEAVEAGTVMIVGTDRQQIVRQTMQLLDNKNMYDQMSRAHNPYGDGNASARIVEYLNAL